MPLPCSVRRICVSRKMPKAMPPKVDDFDGVAIALDRRRRMMFDFAAVKAFRRETGKTLLRQINLTDLDEVELTVLIWVGLLRDDPELTREDVDRIVTMANLPKVWEALAVAFGGAMPEPEEDASDIPLAESRPSS